MFYRAGWGRLTPSRADASNVATKPNEKVGAP